MPGAAGEHAGARVSATDRRNSPPNFRASKKKEEERKEEMKTFKTKLLLLF